MSGSPFRYTTGPGLAVCGPQLVALVDLSAGDDLVGRLFELVSDPSRTLDEALEVLLLRGLREVSDFALGEVTPAASRIVVRGRFTGRFGDGPSVESHGLWSDRTAAAGSPLSLSDPLSPAGETLPIGLGIVRASSILATVPASAAGGASAAVPVPVPVSAATPSESVTETESVTEAAVESEPVEAGVVAASSAAPAPVAEAVPEAGVPEPADQPELALDEPSASGAASPSAETMIISDPAAPEYDFLFGGGLPAPAPVAAPEAGPSGTPVADAEPAPVPAPGAEIAPEPAAEAAVAPETSAPESSEHTIPASALLQNLEIPHGHTLPGVILPLPEAPAPPVAVGVLRLSTGQVIELTGTCIFGRNPRVPDGYTGAPPNLVRLYDPEKDISNQHLAVTVNDRQVLVTDLGSTNGTQVTLPGLLPTPLRAYQPLVVPPGTTIVLAGVLSLSYEPAT